jgi:hypothetical protein
MAIDLTGRIDPAREYVFAERPQDPEMRDSVSFWVFDDRGEVGLPRVGIEAVAANWETHSVQVNVTFADRTVYRLRDDGKSRPVDGPNGMPAVLGAGPLAFTCVEPFEVWTMTFDGKAVQTSSADLVAGRKDGPLVDLRFDVEARLAVPPWVQGALQADADSQLKTSIVGDLMGGPRYDSSFAQRVPCESPAGNASFPEQVCASAARVSAGWKGSGATAGSRHSSRAAGRSDTSPIRRARTGSRISTRVTCSRAAAS